MQNETARMTGRFIEALCGDQPADFRRRENARPAAARTTSESVTGSATLAGVTVNVVPLEARFPEKSLTMRRRLCGPIPATLRSVSSEKGMRGVKPPTSMNESPVRSQPTSEQKIEQPPLPLS